MTTGKSLVPVNPSAPLRVNKLAKVREHGLIKRAAKIEYITDQEYIALYNAAEHPEHKLLIRLLYETGLRITEAITLQYTDIYPDSLNIIGKRGKQRTLPCQRPLLDDLLRVRMEQNMTGRIFQRIRTRQAAGLMLKRVALKAGVAKRIHPHLFRHSFAINVLKQTGNPFALQDLGGWADMETVKIYLKLAKEAPKEAIQRMQFPEVR